ncbi:HAD-IC family P-type ATPase [Actinacidiphila glaucinigra]|uniref:HAD-IC family P-type ATPase n=1 Tax=Actinacidiphila glaucinigra TaxID=235986 RepID=UPI00379B7E3D
MRAATGLGLLIGLPAAGLRLAATAPGDVARHVLPLADAGARVALRSAVAASRGAVRLGRATQQAMTPGRSWVGAHRLHVPLRPRRGAVLDRRQLESAARRVAVSLAEHPDVLAAYWDGGLESLVVQLAEDAVAGKVAARAAGLAADQQLEQPEEPELDHDHPGQAASARVHATALCCDMAGVATATTARVLRLRPSPRLVTAAVTALREDSRPRGWLRHRLGEPTADAFLSVAYAAAHGFGQSPTALVLDASLRAGQLLESVARAALFDEVHDRLCVPGRHSLPTPQVRRPRLHVVPAQQYADQAVTGGLLGAVATLAFTRNGAEAAEAVLAAAPRAARYGPVAFTAALGTGLARRRVLVRDLERIRQLELVDTVVLHHSVLSGRRRTLTEASPLGDDWDHDRLWHAAAATLRAQDEKQLDEKRLDDKRQDEAEVRLRAAAGSAPGTRTGRMTALDDDNREVGTVFVAREVDPLAEAVLDAARRAGLHVVVADDGTLGEFGALADQLVPAEASLTDTVRRLRQGRRAVLTVARVAAGSGADDDVPTGLLSSDVAVTVVDPGSAVLWAADALVMDDLSGVWRLLAAVPGSRAAARHAKVLAEAGAALSELMVLTRGSRGRRAAWRVGLRLSPVNAAAAAALVDGWRGARRVLRRDVPRPRPRVPWHALEPREVLDRLREAERDLHEESTRATSAAGRLGRSLAASPAAVPLRLTGRLAGAVRAELDDPLTPVLAVGATASALLGSAVDAFLVTGAMGINALVGGIQRLRAEQALASLAVTQRQQARRVVDPETGDTRTVEAGRLTPGEIIELQTGDVVPADARLLGAEDLEVDESSLTGESLPTLKQTEPTPRVPVPDRHCMVFQGATVVAGQGRAVVVDTGDDTEAGRAAHLAARMPPAPGVQARLRELTSTVLPLTLAGGAAVTGLSLLRGTPVRQAVAGGLAVAVAAVPEGLPLTATVAQLAAARRLTAHGVLVRTPRTLEALGRMDTVCFDKTGTLTENRLRVVRTAAPDGGAHENDSQEGREILRQAARTCPQVGEDHGVHAHATDGAVLDAAGDDPHWTPADTQPFQASRGYASATGHDAEGTPLLVVKGAPEVVLPLCPDADGTATETARALAAEGLRVLAVAKYILQDGEFAGALERSLEQYRLHLSGFIALADTPRSDAAPLISGLREAGVRPVMLTGDHPETARAVAVALGWSSDVSVVTGDELATRDRTGRASLVRDCGVVARVAPEQKLQVVEALRESGRVVGMVGDGSNDAAAIRAADVGVGIAVRGSAAARNAADLVIVNDELSALIEAVAEGRALWHSVADALTVLIGGNAGEIGFSLLGTVISGASPLSTRQLLLVNLLTDMFPAMAVAVTPQGATGTAAGTDGTGTEGRGARTGTAPLGLGTLGAPLAHRIRHRGIVTALGAAAAWLVGTVTPGSARRTSTMALCGVVGAQLTQTVTGRRHSPLVWLTVLGSAAALIAVIQTPGVSQFFGCTPLGPIAWAGVAAAVALAALAPRPPSR